MDEQLAAIYGTGMPEAYDDEDLQKTAAAELLVKLAEEEGVDLDDFSDEEVAGMIQDLYADGAQGGDEGGEGEGAEIGEEKVAEADFLGRVMAHSMVQELGNIEKAAAKEEMVGPQIGKARLGYRRGKALAGKAVAHQRQALRGAGGAAQALVGKGMKGYRGMAAKELAKNLGKAAPTIGAAGLAAYGGYRGVKALAGGKKKESSALDSLAEQRAYEMLAEAGYEVDQGGYEKTALDQAVEVQALQMLEAAGYPVEWNE